MQDLATKQVTELTTLSDVTDSSRVSWSPNGKKILYADSKSEVYTIWPDGSHRTVISDGDSYAASWSPDGTRIAFLEDPDDDHLSVTKEDGSVVWVPVQKGTYQELGSPAWSPDGTKLLFTMSNHTLTGTAADLFAIDVEMPDALPQKVASNVTNEYSWRVR